MLRTDWTAFEKLLRVARPALAQMPRGTMEIDSVDLAANVADGKHLPDMLGLKVSRLASLANDKYVYKNSAGSTISSN